MRPTSFPRLPVTLVCLLACSSDPTGPTGALVVRRLSPSDSILVGAPGRALSAPILFQVVDDAGRPVAGAAVSWTVVGANGRLDQESRRSDARGEFGAVWLLGTVASESQALGVRVEAGQRVAADTVTAVAQPVEIRSIAFTGPETTTVKLGVATPLPVQAVDPFGNRFVPAGARFVSLDTALCRIDAEGVLRTRKRGFGRVAVLSARAADTIVVHVVQVATMLVVSKDTLKFHSLGQASALTLLLLDDQGQAILDSAPALTSIDIGDTTVAEPLDSLTIRAHGNGVTYATLWAAGLSARVVLEVDQVPVTLQAAVAFGQPVVTLPVGASLPLSCQVLDGNQHPIARDPVLVGSVRGSVGGSGCSDARVLSSGYDTLLFAVGALSARVPVIIASAPDSVGVLTSAQPLTTVPRDSFVGEDLSAPQVLALRPLVAEILAAYGNPATNLDRARAIRDWVARTAVYPDRAVHPDTSTSNLSVLPAATTWADVNAVLTPEKWDEDRIYWGEQYYDGYTMLDRLLGTLDPVTGVRADDGMMAHVSGARYRMRDIATYHYPLCSYEAIIANVLWAAAGLQGMRVATLDHDPAAVFIPELGRWVYEDPTFSEEYQLDGVGDPLSPTDLLTLSNNGEGGRLRPTKLPGPSFDPQVYASGRSYLDVHPEGMTIMGGQLYNRVAGAGGGWTGRYVQIDVPQLATAPWPLSDPAVYDRVTAGVAFPTLGVVLQQVQVDDSVNIAHLGSTLPGQVLFERRVNGGAWVSVADADVLPVGQCRVEYRSVDALGNISAIAALDVWLPRAPGFLESGAPGGARSRAQYCS